MDDITVLVTGGAGFIGAHVCEALFAAGIRPVVLDDLSTGHRDFIKWGPFVEGRVGDASCVRDACGTYRPVACIHLAGLIEVGQSMLQPDRYYAVNVDETTVLLDALVASGVDAVIYSSSAAVYETQDTPLKETDRCDPKSPYARSKWMVEQQLEDRAQLGLRSVVFRYFNAAGGHPTQDIGESHLPETHLIPSILDVAAGRRKSLTVFGTTYPTPDGTCIRDYVHVVDVAQAHVMAVRHLLAGGGSQTFNVGAGHGYSVKEVIDAAEFVVGHLIPVTNGPQRLGDVPSLVADTTRIKQWGWVPRRSDLHTMIADACQWRGRTNVVLDR